MCVLCPVENREMDRWMGGWGCLVWLVVGGAGAACDGIQERMMLMRELFQKNPRSNQDSATVTGKERPREYNESDLTMVRRVGENSTWILLGF